MGIWVHVGVDFWEMRVRMSLSNVVMSWLRPKTTMECIPHPYHIYKVFQHLDMPWMGIWVCPYTVAPVQGRGGFLGNWGMAEPV
jgi:hypothetical protein